MNEVQLDDQDKSPPVTGVNDPAILLAQGLSRSLELEREHVHQEIGHQTASLLVELGQIRTAQQQLMHQLQAVQTQAETFLSTNQLLEEASRQNHILSEQHYDDHVIGPMIRALFPVLDIVYDAVKSCESESEPTSSRFSSFVKAIWTQLQQFLLLHDVEIVCHPARTRFDARIMRPVKTHVTDSRDLDGLVVRCLQIGFRQGSERLLRPETVSVSRYRPGQFETVTPYERKDDDSRN